MKRTIVTMIFVMIISVISFGQLTGTKNIPGDYTNLSNAIFALNALGVGPGGVTFVIAGGFTETFPALTSGLITATGTAADPIIFQRGVGGVNPVITGFTTGPNVFDYVIGLQGTDYITFDGINVADPTGVIEWGYAVLKGSGTNGSQNVTIKNCQITLKQSNISTVGIYSANILPGTAPTALLTVTDLAGGNSNNKFFSNTISACYNGIIVNGFADPNAPYAYYDQSNEIGKDGGNTITSPGGGSTAASGILTTYQDRLDIAYNTVSGTVANTTGAFGAIQLNTSRNSNVSVYSNTVNVTYNASSGSFYGIYNNMGTTYTNNTASFYNNTVSNCNSPNATSGNAYYMYVNNSAQTLNVYNNNVLNNTYGSASTTSTGSTVGFYFFGSASTLLAADIHNNNFSNFTRFQSATGTGGITYCFWIGIGSSISTISAHDNVIDNIITPTNGLLAGFYFIGAPGYKNLYRNSVTNLTTNAGPVYGCYSGDGYNQYLYNNKFQNLKTNGSGTTGYVYGMYLSGSSNGGPMYVYNNIITELRAPNGASGVANAGSGGALCGIYGSGGGLAHLGIYNNTVYLDGTSTVASFNTTALFLGYQPGVIDLQNNILVNNCVPTVGGFALALKSNAYSIYSLDIANLSTTSNNNLFYAGTPGVSNLITMISNNDASYFVYDQTLNQYKTREWPKECNSITGMPGFVQTGVSPYNLHIDLAGPSICESAGKTISTPIAITNDYDNDARYPNAGYPENPSYPALAPDMGADEFAGIPDDKLAPTIIYTPFANSTSTDDRVLTATITDIHGVPNTGAGLPRLAWRKFYNGTWNYVDGVSVASNQYTFTFGGGVNTGDSIYYYVVAQDQFTVPNVGTFPLIGSSGYSAFPPAASVAPTTPSSYRVIAGRCGTLTVGSGQYYPTITAAFNDLAAEGVTCPVILELTDNTYPNETWPLFINAIPGSSAINTVTMRPAPGMTPVIGTSIATVGPYYYSMISLNGCQYVTFDGSNGGGSDRSMTISNTFSGTGGSAAIGLHNNGSVGAGNITIKNCNVSAVTDYVGNKQAIVCFTIVGNAGYHDILITNNEVKGGKFGIQIAGIISNICNNVVVTNNLIGSSEGGYAITSHDLSVTQATNVLIQGNEILGPPAGMSGFFLGQPIGINILSGVTNLTIKHNKIHDLYSMDPVTATGINYNSTGNTTMTEISDNLIYNIKSAGSNATFTGANAYGIYIGTGSNFKIQHNSIWMEGSYLNATTATLSACVNIRSFVTGIDFRNNILKNSSQLLPGGTAASKSYCIAVGNSPTAFSALDYNDYYCDGIGAQIGSYNSVDKTTLASWQTATGQDAHAINVDPVYTSATNLLPTSAAMPKAGIYIPALPVDYDGVTRTNPPDMGAYEFSTVPSITTTAASDIQVNSATLNGTINPNSMDASVYFDYGTTSAYGTTVNGTPFLVNGGVVINASVPLTSLDTYTTYHFRIRTVTFGGVTVYGNDMTFTTMSTLPEYVTVTGTVGEAVTNCYNASNTIIVAGNGTTFDVYSGGSTTLIAWQKISLLPGTTVHNGGYLHGYISPGTYCPAPAMPAVVEGTGETTSSKGIAPAYFSIFPNPTNGNFTLVQKGDKLYGNVKVEVYTMRGDKVMTETMVGEKQHDFGFSEMPTGIYFVKVVADGYVETMKLVKL